MSSLLNTVTSSRAPRDSHVQDASDLKGLEHLSILTPYRRSRVLDLSKSIPSLSTPKYYLFYPYNDPGQLPEEIREQYNAWMESTGAHTTVKFHALKFNASEGDKLADKGHVIPCSVIVSSDTIGDQPVTAGGASTANGQDRQSVAYQFTVGHHLPSSQHCTWHKGEGDQEDLYVVMELTEEVPSEQLLKADSTSHPGDELQSSTHIIRGPAGDVVSFPAYQKLVPSGETAYVTPGIALRLENGSHLLMMDQPATMTDGGPIETHRILWVKQPLSPAEVYDTFARSLTMTPMEPHGSLVEGEVH